MAVSATKGAQQQKAVVPVVLAKAAAPVKLAPLSTKPSIPPAKSAPQAVTQKISTVPSHRINEPLLSAPYAKKIATFNKEASIHTKAAYDAIKSGLRGA